MRSDPETLDHNMLDRYLAGDATAEERQCVEQWLAGRPDVRRQLSAVHTKVSAPYGPVPRYDVDTRIAAVVDYSLRSARRKEREADAYRLATTRRLPFSRATVRAFAGASAAIAMVAVAIVAGVRRDWSFSPTHATAAVSTYATSNGERATITLPDGSTVLLNVGSRVQVPANFGNGNRTVHLTGEAVFSVSHHQGNPFTVVAGPSTTRVLGTRFLVRHYENDSAATVAVRDGKVAVDATVLTAAQQISVGWNAVSPVQPLDATQFSFEAGVLTLKNKSLRDAIPALNRWYNANIRITDPELAVRRITVELEAGSLADLSVILEGALNGIGVARDGQTLTLFRR